MKLLKMVLLRGTVRKKQYHLVTEKVTHEGRKLGRLRF